MIVIKKIKKEVEEMKKFFVLALALLLAVPAISYAGSASSRWDVMIGGYIKMDFGYSDQMRGQQYWAPIRGSKGQEVAGDEYGNWLASGVQTRVNMTIKGPDVWGMKTMGFIEGDFYGSGGTGTYNSQGDFRLRHAFIKLIDKNFEITFAGNTTQIFGTLAGQGQILLTLHPYVEPGMSVGPARMPQINFEYFALNRDLAFLIGIFSNTQTVGTNYQTGKVDSFTMGNTPFVHGRIMYSTDKCGKIGNDKLTFLVDGFYGQEKKARDAAGWAGVSPNSTAAKFTDEDVDSWGIHANMLIPIIPEKKGNKAGSLAFSMYAYMTQNPGFQGPGVMNEGYVYNPMDPAGTTGVAALSSYWRANGDAAANLITAWAPQVYFYLTDQFMVDLYYGYISAKQSNRYKSVTANSSTIEKIQQYGIILAYDPNPALKFTLGYDYNKADYSRAYTGIDKEGKGNIYKFCAFYFF